MMYGTWDMEHYRQNFLSIWTVFCPFTPLWTLKIKILKKWKKKQKKTLEYIIILPMCTINDSRMMYGSWDMECNGQNFLSFWTIFCLFYPPNNPKNQKFEKMKKMPADIIILHICMINDNHMMYCFWDMKRDRQNFFVISDHFLPFYPTNNPKNQNFKKLKKAWRYYHFKHVCHKWQSYDVWFLKYLAWWTDFFVILDHFCPFTPPPLPKNQKNQNLEKMVNKKCLEIS